MIMPSIPAFTSDALFLLPYPLPRDHLDLKDQLNCVSAMKMLTGATNKVKSKQVLKGWYWLTLMLQPEHEELLTLSATSLDISLTKTFESAELNVSLSPQAYALAISGELAELKSIFSSSTVSSDSLSAIVFLKFSLFSHYTNTLKEYLVQQAYSTTSHNDMLAEVKALRPAYGDTDPSTFYPIRLKKKFGKLESGAIVALSVPQFNPFKLDTTGNQETIISKTTQQYGFPTDYEHLEPTLVPTLIGSLSDRLTIHANLPFKNKLLTQQALFEELTVLVDNAISTNDPSKLLDLASSVLKLNPTELTTTYVECADKRIRLPIFLKKELLLRPLATDPFAFLTSSGKFKNLAPLFETTLNQQQADLISHIYSLIHIQVDAEDEHSNIAEEVVLHKPIKPNTVSYTHMRCPSVYRKFYTTGNSSQCDDAMNLIAKSHKLLLSRIIGTAAPVIKGNIK